MSTVLAELKTVMEQYGAMANGTHEMSYDEKKKLVRELVKSPAVKKLSSELAKHIKDKMKEEATPREREMCASDIASMLAYELGAMAAFESMTEESAEIETIRTKAPKMIEAYDAALKKVVSKGS